MSAFREMSEEEKETIRKQHEEATKNFYLKKAEEKAGLQPKKAPEEKPKDKDTKK